MIRIEISGRCARIQETELLTCGSVGIRAAFSFDGWGADLSRTAVFAGSGCSRDVLLGQDNRCNVPPEVISKAGGHLRIGLYGTDGAGNCVIATVWADAGRIEKGSVPSGIDPDVFTPTLATQALTAAASALQIAQGVQAAAAAGEFDGEQGPQGEQGEKGDKGDTGERAITWYTDEAPEGWPWALPLTALRGPNGYTPEAGQMVVCLEDGKGYLIAYIEDGSAVFLGSTVQLTENRPRLCFVSAEVDPEYGTEQNTQIADILPQEYLQIGDVLIGTNGYAGVITGFTEDSDHDEFAVYESTGVSFASTLRGPKGDTGAQGPQGSQGIQGEQGEKGDSGRSGWIWSSLGIEASGGTHAYRFDADDLGGFDTMETTPVYAGDAVLYDGYLYPVSEIIGQYVYADRRQSILGMQSGLCVVWTSQTSPQGPSSERYISLNQLSGPEWATPQVGHIVMAPESNALAAWIITGVEQGTVALLLQISL